MANFVEYLRLGESYTSLVLGMIVVIIATIMLLSVVHTRQVGTGTPEATPTIAASNSLGISTTAAMPKAAKEVVSQAPTVQPTVPMQIAQNTNQKVYTVVAGDNLWNIAQKVYNSGYNWVDIAKANHLVNPGDIHVGNKLVIPHVTTMIATVHTADDNMSSTVAPSLMNGKIIGNVYVVVKDDDLWHIAVRAYGDGYQWVKIAKANNLTNPSLIHVGNKLIIPRN